MLYCGRRQSALSRPGKIHKMLRQITSLFFAAMLWLGAQPAIAQQIQANQPEQFAAEIAAFSTADENRVGDCAIVFVGSSSIRMWRALEADMAPSSVVNRGFGGATIADVNYYFDALFGRRAPRAIFFYAGENDIAAGQTPHDVVAAFRRFLRLKNGALGATPVYFISLKPSLLRFQQIASQRQVNNAIRRFARSRSDLHFVNVAAAMMEHGAPRDVFVEDGLHMNEHGYAIWARILRPLVAREMSRSGGACGAPSP